MRCRFCGNENVEGARFCTKCGKAMAETPVWDEADEPTMILPKTFEEMKKEMEAQEKKHTPLKLWEEADEPTVILPKTMQEIRDGADRTTTLLREEEASSQSSMVEELENKSTKFTVVAVVVIVLAIIVAIRIMTL